MRRTACCMLPLIALLPAARAGAADEPKAAVPDAAAATRLAADAVDKGVELGPPRLFSQDEGLAVDRSDLKEPRVVAYVGPTWIVPVKGEHAPGTAGPGAVLLDRGTGRLVARAHDIEPMPKAAVIYVDEFQLPANAIKAGDAISPYGYGSYGGLRINLDAGGKSPVMMQIMPLAGTPRPNPRAKNSRIKFGGQIGTLSIYAYANDRQIIQAYNRDKTLMASANAMAKAPNLLGRFKEIVAELKDRPQETRIWPADARPWAGAIDGWESNPNAPGNVGLWAPVTRAVNPNPGVMITRVNYDIETYLAAQILHPYELPPAMLSHALHGGKQLSSRPAQLEGWVGVEKLIEFTGSPMASVTPYYNPRAPKGKSGTYRVRLLDLRRDVRRLLIRCQAPKAQFDKRADEFAAILEQMKIPRQPSEPVVVPLNPAAYESPKEE